MQCSNSDRYSITVGGQLHFFETVSPSRSLPVIGAIRAFVDRTGICGGSNKWRAPSGLSVCGRRSVQGNGAKRISFVEKNDARVLRLLARRPFTGCPNLR
jgi:hypothetical protein